MSGIKGNAPISPMSLIIDPDIILVDSGDLTITLISSSGNGSIKHITSIQASAEECRKSYFLGPLIASGGEELTLGEGPPKRANGGELGVDYEDKEGVLIWLAHLHGLSVKEMSGLELDRISIAGVWHATLLWKYREDNNMATLGSWFNEWYMTFMKDNIFDGAAAKALAMSCYTFKHAEGFAYVTKWLVLNHVDYINEHFPTGFKAKGLRLPHAEFVGPINHARNNLKSALQKNLWYWVGTILRNKKDTCNCWDATIGQYLAALDDVKAFPVDEVIHKASIMDILERLGNFTMTYKPTCTQCNNFDWEGAVKEAVNRTKNHFDGLCLHCMDRSRPRAGDVDSEFWKHNQNFTGRWDTLCSIEHNQATWYISWLGSAPLRQKLLRNRSSFSPNWQNE